MSDLDNKHSIRHYVGRELTKKTVVDELVSAMGLLERCGSSKHSTAVCIDFINLKRVDTLAVVFIVQIERFIAGSVADLKITYQNLPNDLVSLLDLTSVAPAIFSE